MSVAKSDLDIPAARSGVRPDLGGLILFAAALALTVILYYGTITWWVFEWTREGSFYAHGVFIPFFVGLMIWRDRERLRRLPVERCWWGIGLVAIAIALVLLAERAQVTVPVSISFIMFLIGSTLVVAGARITRALLFPMLFLFTMIPIVPDQLINPIAFPIQLTSAKMAASICNLIGFPAVRTGTQIAMEHFNLDVELPCSGFKTLLGLLSFSAAFAYVVEAENWKRWTLFAISAPLAILVNGVRITLIGLAGEVFGERAAHVFHDYSGFIVLILGFTFLFNFARVLRCNNFLGVPLTDDEDDPNTVRRAKAGAKPDTPKAATSKAAPSDSTESTGSGNSDVDSAARLAAQQEQYDLKWGKPRGYRLGFLAAGLYPIIFLLVPAVIAKPSIVPPKVTMHAVEPSELPANLAGGEWQQNGRDILITPEVKAVLSPLTYINRIYRKPNSDGGLMEMLLTSGSGRKVFHDPHTCFMGNGYAMSDMRVETIDTPSGPLRVQVSEAENTQDHSKTLLMFCYVVGGTQYQTTQQVNTALIWQQLLGDHGRPSYFLRFRAMADGTGKPIQDGLKSFIRAVWTEIGPKVVGTGPNERIAHR